MSWEATANGVLLVGAYCPANEEAWRPGVLADPPAFELFSSDEDRFDWASGPPTGVIYGNAPFYTSVYCICPPAPTISCCWWYGILLKRLFDFISVFGDTDALLNWSRVWVFGLRSLAPWPPPGVPTRLLVAPMDVLLA